MRRRTRLSPEQEEMLATLPEARDRARREYRDAVAQRVAAGIPQNRIAAALGVSPMTIWRLLNPPQENGPRAVAPAGSPTHQEESDEQHKPY